MIDTLVKGLRTEKIKFKELPSTLTSGETCSYDIKSFEAYFNEDGDRSESEEQESEQ